MRVQKGVIGSLAVLILAMVVLNPDLTLAKEKVNYLQSKNYESKKMYSSKKEVERFAYGKDSLGEFYFTGKIKKTSKINGYDAYSVMDEVKLGYEYNNQYQDKKKKNWKIISDSEKSVNGENLDEKIKEGAVIIKKSKDGKKWKNACKPLTDFFRDKKIDKDEMYYLTERDIKQGTYFKIYIAYKMEKKKGTEKGIIPFTEKEIYDTRYCLEEYKFYICYGENPIEIRNIISGESVGNNEFAEKGIVVDKKGANATVTVKKESEPEKNVDKIQSFFKKGKYTIEVKDPLKNTYKQVIRISDGLKNAIVTPKIYESQKKYEIVKGGHISGETSFGIEALTKLTVAHSSKNPIEKSTHKKIEAYGISGDSVYIFMQLCNQEEMKKNGWSIVNDNWGKKDKQTIEKANTGKIDSGALIIQTSANGKTWKNVEKGRYASGLYTTDYNKHYGKRGDVLIYQPNGKELLKGLYVRVIYAYQVKKDNSKDKLRVMEEYKFYLCSNELDAIAFHNNSVTGEINEICKEYDDTNVQVYRQAETMLSGAYTVSGFTIDKSLNPTVDYIVKRNGRKIAIPSDYSFSDSGKYDIELKSAVGNKKNVTIYVDTQSNTEILARYFGKGFIRGKRIYDEGEFPVYEGGRTEYFIEQIDKEWVPITGEIKNNTTGSIIHIERNRLSKKGKLSEPGEYEAIFTTNPSFSEDATSGDARKITFKFRIIPKGTAPGPVVNKRSLQKYASSTITDVYPIYYGVTYPSASRGNITVAFATKKEAFEYAYNYEKGMVEKQSDGTFRYQGSFRISQKEKYESSWDLTDACNYFAEQAIQPFYFDLSDEFTYLTLDNETIKTTDNLRTLELDKSVVIFADNQKEQMVSSDVLPIISQKKNCFLYPGQNGKIEEKIVDFEFVKDKYECDSSNVQIVDSEGNTHSINYNEGVGRQLRELKCPSGIISINEKNIYGDETQYQAIYIADDENNSEITISYSMKGKGNKQTLSQKNSGTNIDADYFSIESFKDELDPYCLVIVSNEQKLDFYVADQNINSIWSEPGKYTIKVVNRMGNNYSFSITINESKYTTISFEGAGVENEKSILTTIGSKNVKLPLVKRYGYNLIGYSDTEGNEYKDKIPEVTFKNGLKLSPIWEAKQYTLSYVDKDGKKIKEQIVEFGKEYELPMSLIKDKEFEYWIHNGEPVRNNKFTLDKEGNITLIAKEAESQEEHEVEEKNNNVWFIMVIFLIISIVLVCGNKYLKLRLRDKVDK